MLRAAKQKLQPDSLVDKKSLVGLTWVLAYAAEGEGGEEGPD